ncbi:N-acetyltransferase [Trabulsiella odontotermitis]|uniref:N-acetyltransferase n=1 Tax=Trabulsiella odontotermitis TaxID=379893 RepID=UPI003ACC42F9
MGKNQEESDILLCAYQADITYPGQKHFDCGNVAINHFVRNSLKKNVKEGNCAARALIDGHSGELLGCCTFTAYSLDRDRLAAALSGSLPGDVGVVRLVMLGVAQKVQRRGFGLDLLSDFFRQIKLIHQSLPLKGVYLDAAPEAINFYARLGFAPLSVQPGASDTIPLFLAIQHILAA